AKVVHAPPNGFSHFFWRFLLIGHDYYWQKRLISEEAENPNLNIEQEDLVPDRSFAGWAGKLGVFGDRLYKMQQNNPWHLLYLPAALPIALVSALLIYAGYLITSIWPKYLLNTYERVLGDS
ncbi:glycosyl transferase family 2, partial [filamentous cyanobacterium CCP1]